MLEIICEMQDVIFDGVTDKRAQFLFYGKGIKSKNVK